MDATRRFSCPELAFSDASDKRLQVLNSIENGAFARFKVGAKSIFRSCSTLSGLQTPKANTESLPDRKVCELDTASGQQSPPPGLNPSQVEEIAHSLSVKPQDIDWLGPLSGGLTNTNFTMRPKTGPHAGHRMVLRIPGVGTSELIDRKAEYQLDQPFVS